MKYYFLPLLLSLITCYSYSQDENPYKPASAASEAYSHYRNFVSEPPYGLKKIKPLVSKLMPDEAETEKLGQATYLSLSLREKFTYHMIHGESYSQICDLPAPIQDEHKKIFGRLPDMFMEYSWGDRQKQFLRANRDSVMKFIKDCVAKDKRIGVNFKHAIVEINGREMIPFLISTYKIDKKDHDILTVLMLLMKNNEYKEFMVSTSNKKLYGDEMTAYDAYLNFNIPNEELIIKRATDFYNGLSK
jgi:hypothetical protein